MGHLSIAGPVDLDSLPEYPFSAEDRLDSHYFMTWERRRWLNSDMRLNGTPECRAYYFDLINIAFDQSPIGTLPQQTGTLAKLLYVQESHFAALAELEYGPLHRWEPCRCGGEVRLMHPMVLKTISDAVSRKADNRALNEAANAKKRLQRLRGHVTGYHAELGKNDAAIVWMDGWLQEQGCVYRSSDWVERAMGAWSNHMFDLTRKNGTG